MNNEKYINNITLEYLLNPHLYEKIHSDKNNIDESLLRDIDFYKERLCKMTKDMCKGKFINNNIKNIYYNYATTIIYYLKQLDEKDLLQSYYNDLNLDNNIDNNNAIGNSSDISLIPTSVENLVINKISKNKSLDNFVKKININKDDKILPQRRVANISDPALKKKGLKKKIST